MKTDSCWGPTALILREPLPTSVWQRHSCQWKQIQKITRQVLTKPNRVFAVSLLLPESTCVLLRPPPLQSTQTLRSLTLINMYYMHLQQHPRFFVFFLPVEAATSYRNYTVDVWERAWGVHGHCKTQRRHDLPAAFTHSNLRLLRRPKSAVMR